MLVSIIFNQLALLQSYLHIMVCSAQSEAVVKRVNTESELPHFLIKSGLNVFIVRPLIPLSDQTKLQLITVSCFIHQCSSHYVT